MLVLTRKTDESITIGSNITISILEVRGNQVKLSIKAPKEISVNRSEVYENIMKEVELRKLIEINQKLAMTFDLKELFDAVLIGLPDLGLSSAYLCLYKDKDHPLNSAEFVNGFRQGQIIDIKKSGKRSRL